MTLEGFATVIEPRPTSWIQIQMVPKVVSDHARATSIEIAASDTSGLLGIATVRK